jgi:peroxiredoxin
MTSPRETEIETLVRAYLDGQAARIDGAAGAARVRAALAPAARPLRWRSRLALAAGIAAAFALILVSGPQRNPARASSRDLVEQVRREHQEPVERCYAGEIRRVSDPHAFAPPRQVRVWTRGDRFWVEMRHADSEPFLIWGREKDGALWAALDAHRGVRISAEQAPRPLTLLADVCSLDVDALLGHVLRDCALTEQPSADGSLRVVRAEPLTGPTRRWLGHATLQIDPKHKELRRLTIARNLLGKPFAEVEFRLVETRPAGGDKYRLEGHLREPRRIHEGNVAPAVKLELLARSLGRKPHQKITEERSKPVSVKDVDGKSHAPLAQKDSKATVLFFLMPDCPISNAYAPEIERICQAYAKKGVTAFIVHADPDTTAEDAKKHAREHKLTASVLLDPTHRLVKRTGVKTAPEVAVVGPDGKTLYHGRIDDWYVDYGKRRAEPTKHDLRDALDNVLAGKAVAAPTTTALGCPLPEPRKE